jgi:hypothetical protein
MKKILNVIFFIAICLSVADVSYAQLRKDRDFVAGKVVKVFENTKEIVLHQYKSGEQNTYQVEKGWESAVVGREVVASVQKGTTRIKSLRAVKPKIKK